MLDSKVLLRSLSVEGFRGVNKQVRLDFGPKATVLSAKNGRGKSTLLGAIEWGLFGELKFQPSENRTRDEMVSIFHPGGRASVRLTLAANGEEVQVHRTKVVGKMGTSVEVTRGGTDPLEADAAEDYLFRLTRLSFSDFYRAAFLHQESIRGLLTEEQKDRDEALDRLLGVEEIRNILTSIPMKPVASALEEIEANEAKVMERIRGAGGMAEASRTRTLQEAVDAGYSEGDLSLGSGQKEASSLQAILTLACSKYGAEVQEPVPVEAIDDFEPVARRIKTTTKTIRYASGKETPLDAAIGQLSQLRKLRREVQDAGTLVDAARTELRDDIDSHGTTEEWDKKKVDARREVERGEAALHILDVHGRVIEDAIAYLETVPDAKVCPICGEPKEASLLASRLKAVVKKDQAIEVRRLNKIIDAARAAIVAIEGFERARARLVATHENAMKEANRVRASAWKALGKKGDPGDALKEIAAQETVINGRLDGLRNLNKEREEDLQKLDDGADRIRTLQRFLKAEADAARVRAKASEGEGGGAKAFEDDKRKLEVLRSDLGAIIMALNGLATGRAQNALGKCGPDISRVYGQLCNHPYFDGLKIELGQKTVAGVQRNTYRIVAFSTKDGEKTAANSRLSTAQMNCVALSAYLSLAKVLTHNLGFILLDDPSQNLDLEHKKSLASVLKGLLPSTQLVIGTHDAEFDGFLRTDLGSKEVSWYDLGWAPRDGTSLRRDGSRNG